MPELAGPAVPRLDELPEDPALLRAVVVQLLQQLNQAQGRIGDLQQQVEQLVRRLYGRSSEKLDPNQVLMDALLIPALEQRATTPPTAVTAAVKVEAHTRKVTPHGRTIFPETLKHEEIIIPVPESERICPVTGRERPVIGYEESKKLDYRQPELIVKVFKREKRGSVAGAEEVGVITAPPPEGPIPKGLLDNGLLAQVAVSKFVDHMPLYRQEKMFERLGSYLSRRTLCDSLLAAAVPLQGLSDCIKAHVLANGTVLHDDTPVDLVSEGIAPGRNVREARLWVGTVPVRDGPWVHFTFTLSRESQHVKNFFANYRGNVMSDDYIAYDSLDPGSVKRSACMTHARRKFFEAKDAHPVEAAEMLERIGALYHLESSVDPAIEHDALRLRMRQEQAVPALAQIRERLDAWALKALPKSPLGKAVAYALSNWPRLIRYTEDPTLPIDNNAAEQAIRPVAVGRRNWLFMGSERGGQAAAIYMTLVATCRRAGVNPYDYFRDIFARIMSHSSQKLDELVPGNWKPRSI
jgi:transposase